MTRSIQEFRSDRDSVLAARAVLDMPIVKEMLAVLLHNGPAFRPTPDGLTPTDASVRLGHNGGYQEHHQRFEELAELWPRGREQIQPTYEDPEQEE